MEDPVHEDDFESMAKITSSNPSCIVAGDDMLVTNARRVRDASRYGACSGAILKVNQAGSLYEALDFSEECKTHKNENNNFPQIRGYLSTPTYRILLLPLLRR